MFPRINQGETDGVVAHVCYAGKLCARRKYQGDKLDPLSTRNMQLDSMTRSVLSMLFTGPLIQNEILFPQMFSLKNLRTILKLLDLEISIIKSGDFNIHVDISKDPDDERFLTLLESFGLENHVFIQTHESGHALDLLVAKKDCDFSLGSPITDFYISDHSFVKRTINVAKPELEVKDIVFRKLKSINADAFKNDIEVSELCSRDFTDLDELVSCYNATLTELIDKHAPEQRERITVRPKQPWFSNNLAKLERERRKLERMWIKSKTELDHEIYKQCRNMFANTIETDRCKYLSSLVSECNGDQKKLFQVVASLTGDKNTSSLPDHRDPYLLANDFSKFFIKKIEKIQKNIDDICESEAIETNKLPNQSDVFFSEFDVLSEEDVRNLIMKSTSKHCHLDPAPTWLVKKCIDVLLPVITNMMNLSLSSGCFPDAWKCAVVRPLLKKLGLDLLFQNFRPVSNLPYVFKLTEKAVADKLNEHTKSKEILPEKASAYRRDHSTETALIKVQSGMFAAMDNQHVMLDLSAAFDAVNHEMLLNKMESRFGINGTVLNWFR